MLTFNKCRNCNATIPQNTPHHIDELGSYITCPTCASTQDIDENNVHI
jgi:DNA-directed RNA polymerase subunit RPC12/RpoP